MKRRKVPLNTTETVRLIARLFDLYGIDRSPQRDRAHAAEQALYYAVRDGLLRVPAKRGPPGKWNGKLGLALLEAVEAKMANPKKARHTRRRNSCSARRAPVG